MCHFSVIPDLSTGGLRRWSFTECSCKYPNNVTYCTILGSRESFPSHIRTHLTQSFENNTRSRCVHPSTRNPEHSSWV